MDQVTTPEATVFRMTIDGRAVDSHAAMPVLDPATEAVITQAPDCSPGQLDAAVAAARRALPAWRATPWARRADALRSLADRVDSHLDFLALILTREQGKALADARAELKSGAIWLRQTAERTLPEQRRTGAFGRIHQIGHVPVGVVGAISPWNFPVSLSVWKFAPALLAGNTVVLKPSPYTPLTMLKMGELFLDLLPAGVFNVVSGGDHLGPRLTEHPGVDKIAFTGSTRTGRAVMRSASATLKRLTLELGGNDPAIVLPDVDVEAVAPKLFMAAFRNAGQICIASKRIYIHDSIYEAMLAALAAVAARTPPMSGLLEGAVLGPVQNKAQYERVRGMIKAVRAAGGRVIEPDAALPACGYFIAPTLVDDPPDDWPIVREEPFGPVVPLLRYRDIEEAVRRANDSDYALGASVWGTDLDKAAEVAAVLEAGTVWINSGGSLDPDVPFGGLKQSGLGIENGPEGLEEFTNLKVIVR